MYITLNTGQKVTEVYDLSKMSVVEKKFEKENSKHCKTSTEILLRGHP